MSCDFEIESQARAKKYCNQFDKVKNPFLLGAPGQNPFLETMFAKSSMVS